MSSQGNDTGECSPTSVEAEWENLVSTRSVVEVTLPFGVFRRNFLSAMGLPALREADITEMGEYDLGFWFKCGSALINIPAHTLWDAREIQIWMKVTACLANKACHQEHERGFSQEQCLEVRAKIISER